METKNYFMIDGKRIPMSNETAKSILANNEVTLKSILEARREGYYLSDDGNITYSRFPMQSALHTFDIVATKERVKQLRAIALLMNVADYFNDEAEVYPNDIIRFCIKYDYTKDVISTHNWKSNTYNIVWFEKEEDAKKAIKILGVDTIRLALTGRGDLTEYKF